MTLAAVWQYEPNRVHAIADSRFSHERGVATEHGPKLLPLNVVCRKPGPSKFFDTSISEPNLVSHIAAQLFLLFVPTR